jgi:plastocyanin
MMRRLHVFGHSTLTAGILAFIVAACGTSDDPKATVSRGPGPAEAKEIVADNLAFIPETLELNAGAEIAIEITNEDDVVHDFAIRTFGLNTGSIEPGEIATVTFTVPEGTTDFRCTIHALSAMEGEIEGR